MGCSSKFCRCETRGRGEGGKSSCSFPFHLHCYVPDAPALLLLHSTRKTLAGWLAGWRLLAWTHLQVPLKLFFPHPDSFAHAHACFTRAPTIEQWIAASFCRLHTCTTLAPWPRPISQPLLLLPMPYQTKVATSVHAVHMSYRAFQTSSHCPSVPSQHTSHHVRSATASLLLSSPFLPSFFLPPSSRIYWPWPALVSVPSSILHNTNHSSSTVSIAGPF